MLNLLLLSFATTNITPVILISSNNCFTTFSAPSESANELAYSHDIASTSFQ